jgi:hypothetical protein
LPVAARSRSRPSTRSICAFALGGAGESVELLLDLVALALEGLRDLVDLPVSRP